MQVVGSRSEHTVSHNQGFPPAQTAQLQPFPTTNLTSPSHQWSQSNKHTAAGWNFIPKWQMPLWQTLHSTFTWNLCLLPLIKNAEAELNRHFPTARVSLVSVLDERASTFLSWGVRGQPLHCLPVRLPRLPHAEWLVLTPLLPAVAIHGNMWEGFQDLSRFSAVLTARCSARLGQTRAG